jgi:hypothetical protein
MFRGKEYDGGQSTRHALKTVLKSLSFVHPAQMENRMR